MTFLIQTLFNLPSRFTRTSNSRTWNTGNGSPDAICFSVDRSGIFIVGCCVYGGTGTYDYELELLDDQSSGSDKVFILNESLFSGSHSLWALLACTVHRTEIIQTRISEMARSRKKVWGFSHEVSCRGKMKKLSNMDSKGTSNIYHHCCIGLQALQHMPRFQVFNYFLVQKC